MSSSASIYFVHGRPGTGVNLLDRVVRSVIDIGNGDVFFNRGFTFKTPIISYEELDETFWYENVEFLSSGTYVHTLYWWPKFEELKEKRAGTRFIMLTHTVDDVTAIAKNFTRAISQKEIIGWEKFLKGVLETHPTIFPNSNAAWSDLTSTQQIVFAKVLENVIIMEQEWLKTVPAYDYVLEIPFRQFWTDPTTTVNRIKTFAGVDRENDAEMMSIYQTAATKFVTDYLS
jgi:hypothetical protein